MDSTILYGKRIAIERITPTVDDGRFNCKRIVGDSVTVEADVFMDTHDKLAVRLLWHAEDVVESQSVLMSHIGNDRWRAHFPVEKIGHYLFEVEAWRDRFTTYHYGLFKKVNAGIDVTLEIAEGYLLLEKAKAFAEANSGADAESIKAVQIIKQALLNKQLLPDQLGEKVIALGGFEVDAALSTALQTYSKLQAAQLTILLADITAEAMHLVDARDFITRSKAYTVRAERRAAAFSSWYELFPRSQSGDANRHGTFNDVITRLPAIQAMGFDTVYFPPIHPIGRSDRKGRNNTLTPAENDPGSPYAIGAKEGGHEAIHPQLGSWDDFRHLLQEAKSYGIEIALDFAIQCAPDHPWLKQHPDWFDWRPDGTVKHAENPPKKYQDIVNVDFYAPLAIPDLWFALRDIVLLWAKEGVRTFRVDNPHTKPLPFWEWLIAQVQQQYPDTLFLSEAFTNPKMMNRLAKLGFTQSYTYFTWRNTKYELTQYLSELLSDETPEFFRPHFFVNTPDINPFYLQNSGRGGFIVRAALAATLSGLWGISSGFELCEADALPDREEFNHSEKYEVRAWDWNRPGNIIAEISVLNRLRNNYPQLQTHLGAQFHFADNPNVLFYSKAGKPVVDQIHEQPHAQPQLPASLIVVAVNLQPQTLQDTALEMPIWLLGLNDNARFSVHDLVSDTYFEWQGKWQHARLDPQYFLFVIWEIKAI